MNEFRQQKTDNDQFAEFVRWNYPRIDNGTKIEFARCWDTAYFAGVEDERERLRLLAEAVLEAHKGKGHCIDCPHVEYGEDYQRCKGGEYDCCKCTACKVAREVMEI